jgi:hypothetical protein
VEVTIIRRLILGVLVLGMAGLLAELLLLGHYEGFTQWIPLLALAAGLGALALDGAYARWWTHGLLALVMVAFIGTGLLGVYFHFAGSREFQREMDPTMSGATLLWHVLRAKSPPTMAPCTLVQMGILGLGYAYLRRSR